MAEELNRRLFFVSEHSGLLKAAHDYDIHDATTGERILECREQGLTLRRRLLRFSDFKRICAFQLRVRTVGGKELFSVCRGVAVWRSHVRVHDAEGNPIGGFVLRPISIAGEFDVVDANGAPVCRLKGDLIGWNFRFLAANGVELARVTRKWGGIGKELLCGSADYMLAIDDAVPPDSVTRRLLLASVLCIGLVLRIDT